MLARPLEPFLLAFRWPNDRRAGEICSAGTGRAPGDYRLKAAKGNVGSCNDARGVTHSQVPDCTFTGPSPVVTGSSRLGSLCVYSGMGNERLSTAIYKLEFCHQASSSPSRQTPPNERSQGLSAKSLQHSGHEAYLSFAPVQRRSL